MKPFLFFCFLAYTAGQAFAITEEEVSGEVVSAGVQVFPLEFVVKITPVKLVNSDLDSDYFIITTEWWCNGKRIFSWSSELVGKGGLPYIHEPAPPPPDRRPRSDGGLCPV